jgi:preprotein translocase subunit SecA
MCSFFLQVNFYRNLELLMFGKIIEKIFGSKQGRDVQRLTPLVEEVNRIFISLSDLSDEALKDKTNVFKKKIQERTSRLQTEIDTLKAKLRGEFSEEQIDYEAVRQEIERLEKEELEATEAVLLDILPEAFAVVKETCRRFLGKKWKVVEQDIVWDMVPFDVQVMGGIVLQEGKIAEMATGEGKTLAATMPLYLNALVGKGAHLVTVNDYLARRDCEWMGEIYKFLGLSVAYITNDMTPPQRQIAYNADITYGTNNEFGFDYLRDNMAISPENLVQRGHYYTIIDEVDSVLIDEARTPLIISGPVGESKNRFAEMKPKVAQLVRNQSVLINQLVNEGEELLEEGKDYDAGIKLLQGQRGSPKNKRLTKLMHEPGIQKLIRRVESDYMRDKKLNELDEDLYFAIDEKAHTIDLTDKGREALAPGNPEMFVLPDLVTQLSEIEGHDEMAVTTQERKKEELQAKYAEMSERLHNISQLLRAYSLFEKDVEYVVTEDGKVMIVDEFTGRLMPGRRFSDGLHQALEAKENVRIERETQTLATITLQNFFRLYKKLAGMTGTAETEAGEFWEIYKLDVVVIPTNEPIRRSDYDDVVYRTKREKYNAIINEIIHYHEQGLPVLVGTVTVEVSETLSRMLRRRNIRHSVLNAKYHRQEAEIVARAGEPGTVTIATNMAGRGTDIKLGKGVIQYMDEDFNTLVQKIIAKSSHGQCLVVHELFREEVSRLSRMLEEKNQSVKILQSAEEKEVLLDGSHASSQDGVYLIQRSISAPTDAKRETDQLLHIKARDYATGGLSIIGTERHEARRIDRQLRGRSGRQGDPGSSRFYLSLEDDLMRLFGSERIAGVMDRLGVEEGEVITHPMITRSIERAQKRVEMRNFEIRKHLLEYDDVMNKQREVIYTRRKRALEGENLHEDVLEMVDTFVEDLVDQFTAGGEYGDAWSWDEIREELLKTMLLPLPIPEDQKFAMKAVELEERIKDAAKQAYAHKRTILGNELMGKLERFATLKTIDEKWKEHLYEMDQLKEGIGLRAYGQKDPLIEYKQEGFRAFTEMLGRINQEILEIVFKAQIQMEQAPRGLQQPVKEPLAEMATVHEEATGMGFERMEQPTTQQEQQPPVAGKRQPIRVEKKVGRNDPCPCGSGKKYKKCHGRLAS